MLIVYGMIGVTIVAGIAWLVGRAMDIQWRAKTLRNLLKRDYGVLTLINKDNKTHKSVMINFGKDEIRVGKELWIVDQRHIYRADKREKGFFADENNIKFEEGVPTIYVDHDHLEPIIFYKPEGTTKPLEISAWLTSFVANQLAKGKADQEKVLKLLLYITIGLALLGLVGIYFLYQQGNAGNALCNAALNATTTPLPTPVEIIR